MLETVRKVAERSGLNDWRIVEKTTVSHQAFFVKHKLDQHRISNTTHTTLYIYVDREGNGRKMRGSAAHEIFPGTSEEEIARSVETMKYNASLALNPYYELVKNEKQSEEKKDYDLLKVLRTVVTAIQSVKDTATEKINSYEIFANEYYYHIVNSQGVDVSFNTMDEEVEVIINSVDKGHEIELYHRVNFADKPLNEITDGILEVFRYAKDRTQATPTKKGNYTVLMTGSNNRRLLEYFMMKSSTGMVYRRFSQVKPGDVVQSGDDCDKLTIWARRELPYSSRNKPFSEEGLRAQDVIIMEDGVYKNYWGDKTTAYYLGIENITPANNFTVAPGSLTVAEMKKDPYLEIIQFSDFNVNPMTGTFGGEIRLAYWHDGEKVIPVTGGSMTADISEVIKTIRLSRETEQYDYCLVPRTIRLLNVAISGEE